MQRFRFPSERVQADDERLPAFLAASYARHERPLCDCVEPGVAMYIAHVGEQYIVKRMPGSGSGHHPDCPSYEPPAELSGLGEVSGSAIQEDVESGLTTLRLDFALSKSPVRREASAPGAEPDSVRTDGSKLTLRGMLHYLLEEAGLNRWTPRMAGKRSWSVVRKYLLEAATNKQAKGAALDGALFIPETFSVERKAEITQRRLQRLSRLHEPARGARPLLLLVAEVKQIEPARYGHRIIAKHLPDMRLMLAADLYRRLAKRFDSELALWNADEATHLLMIATFGMDKAGNAIVEEASLVLTSPNWIPVDHRWDAELLDALTSAGRRFTKGLRYNLGIDRPLASVVLSDTAQAPVAMYVVPTAATPGYRQALEELVADSDLTAWTWVAADEPMPAFPAPRADRGNSGHRPTGRDRA